MITGTLARTSRATRAAILGLLAVLGCAVLTAERAQAAPTWRADAVIAAAIDEAAMRFGLPRAWISEVIAQESGGDPRAVSPKGAMGLMQLMPGTWAEVRDEVGLADDPFDRRANVLAGAAYLRRLNDRFGAIGGFAAYNAGPGRYLDHVTAGRPLPAETRAYVAAIRLRLGWSDVQPAVGSAVLPLDWRTAPLFVSGRGLGAEDPGVEQGR